MQKIIQILDVDETLSWNVDNKILRTDIFWTKGTDGNLPEFGVHTQDFLKRQHNIEYKVLKFNEIDKSKPWFILVSVQFCFHFNPNNSSDFVNKSIFKGIPDNILDELVHGQANLFLSLEQEHYSNKFFEIFYRLYKNDNCVPAHKLIHLTMAADIKELYEEFCVKHNIVFEQKIKNWFTPHALIGPASIFANKIKIEQNPIKSKKFLNFNRMPRSHRIIATCGLAEFGLLNYGYISLGTTEAGWTKSTSNILNYVTEILISSGILQTNSSLHQITLSGIEKVLAKLPLTVDTDDFTFGHEFTYSSNLLKYYNTSYFSLISNTNFFAIEESTRTLNEKEYRPIAAKHPFILISRPGSLDLLKSFGFKTFNRWFDESYDKEINDEKRMIMILCEVERLCKINDATWNSMLEEMTEILNHNRNRIIDGVEEIIFSTDFSEILKFAS